MIDDFKARRQADAQMSITEKIHEMREEDELSFKELGPFHMMIMKRNRTSNTKTLGRVGSYQSLVFGGNCNGIVGYGKGKGLTPEVSMDKAMNNFRQNLIAINLDIFNTCPKAIYSKFGKTTVVVWPRRYFNSYGSPKFANMLQMAGIHHCKFKVMYDKPNGFNLVYAFMKLLTQNTTPKLLAEENGIKLEDTVWGRKYNHLEDYEEEL